MREEYSTSSLDTDDPSSPWYRHTQHKKMMRELTQERAQQAAIEAVEAWGIDSSMPWHRKWNPWYADSVCLANDADRHHMLKLAAEMLRMFADEQRTR